MNLPIRKTPNVDFAIWSIEEQYDSGVIVSDKQGAVSYTLYLSKRAVPKGARLDNEFYWRKIIEIENSDIIEALKKCENSINEMKNELDAISNLANQALNTANSKTENINTNTSLINELYERFPDCTESHNMIFRGNYLGSEVTDEQWANIADGTFAGLYLGDYWTINGVNWRIWHFNYWINTGDIACTTPHVVIMPDGILYSASMNSTATASGGYVGSEMYTTNLADAKTTINSVFGSSHILSHREYLTNEITDGYASGGDWYDSTIELPNEIMIYGCYINAPQNYLGEIIPMNMTICKTQLALAAISSQYVNIKENYWLRDIDRVKSFCEVGSSGRATVGLASNVWGVRPVFGIC